MSFSAGYVLPCSSIDDALIAHVRTALEQALAQCIARRAGYAGSTLELFARKADYAAFVIRFPAALVQLRGWEAETPGESDTDGTYPCSYELFAYEGMPEHELPAEVVLKLRSNRSANRDAWMTASAVLEAAGALLGGTYSEA